MSYLAASAIDKLCAEWCKIASHPDRILIVFAFNNGIDDACRQGKGTWFFVPDDYGHRNSYLMSSDLECRGAISIGLTTPSAYA